MIPLALDVKKFGNVADNTFQQVLVGIALLFGALYFTLEWLSVDLRAHRSKLQTTTLIWWTYVVLSPLPVLVWGVDLEHYLKVLLPFVLYGTGLTVMVAVERRNIDPIVSLDILVWCALLSTVWRAIYAVVLSGVSIETIRWQILGPGIPLLIGYGAVGLYLRRRRMLSAVALSTALICVLLSITRSYVITGILVIAGLFLADTRRRSMIRAARAGGRLVAMLVLVGSIAAAMTTLARPDFSETWANRLFRQQAESGLDITFITRLAEYRGQINALTENVVTVLIGNGIGADYTRDAKVLQLLAFDTEKNTAWFAGHSTWVFPFFASGIFLGTIAVFVLLLPLVRGFSAASATNVGNDSRGAVLTFVIYLAYLGQSFTANLFSERFTGLILGVVSGAILIYAARFYDLKKRRVFRNLSGQDNPKCRGKNVSFANGIEVR